MKINLLEGEEVRFSSRQAFYVLGAWMVLWVVLFALPYLITGQANMYVLGYVQVYLVLISGFLLSKVISYIRTILIITSKRVIYVYNNGKVFSEKTEVLVDQINHIKISRSWMMSPRIHLYSVSGLEVVMLEHFSDFETIKNLLWHLNKPAQ